MMGSGTAEAVPLSKAGVRDLERLHGRESEEKADGLAVRKVRELPFDYAQGQDDTLSVARGQGTANRKANSNTNAGVSPLRNRR
jgi:hypothetical protein